MTLASYSLQQYSTANLLFVQAHADEIDWRFNGHSFTKSGHGQAKILAALCTPNNTNPPFQNPGSTTGMWARYNHSAYSHSHKLSSAVADQYMLILNNVHS